MTTNSPTAQRERNHPVKTPTAQPEQLRKAERVLRLIWVIAAGAILFSMLTVTPLVQRVTDAEWDWTAPILPLVVDAAVVIVVRMDSEVSRLGAKAGGWATVLRWMTGLFTLGLNIGDSVLKGDKVGVAVHAVAPMLLIATSEAIPRYRRTIALGLERIAREQAADKDRREREQRAERERREQQQSVREEREREAREQAERRREQLERERLEQQERAVREQREHDARMAQEAREFQAAQERQKEDRAEAARQAEQDRQLQLELAKLASDERREQQERAEQKRRDHLAQQDKERRAAVREQSRHADREQPEPAAAPAREQRPLHAVNTAEAKTANSDKVSEAEALEMIRSAVEAGAAGVRALARQTGWSPAWVSGQIAVLRGDPQNDDDAEQASNQDEQVPA